MSINKTPDRFISSKNNTFTQDLNTQNDECYTKKSNEAHQKKKEKNMYTYSSIETNKNIDASDFYLNEDESSSSSDQLKLDNSPESSQYGLSIRDVAIAIYQLYQNSQQQSVSPGILGLIPLIF